MRMMIARWIVLLLSLTLLTGCAGVVGPPRGTVVLYGRAAAAADQWFALVPLGDPPVSVGFGADGVACLTGPSGSDLAWFLGMPGQGGAPRQVLGRVPGDGSQLILSVEIAPDGSLVVGRGVPAWWVGDPESCP